MHYLSITFPDDLKRQLDSQAKREGTKRSTLIQKAVRVYLKIRKRGLLQRLLAEGYQEMEGEARRLGEDFKDLDRESLEGLA